MFVTERLERGNVAITETTLKNDCSLYSKLYIACQAREGNLEEFFRYENQPFPPSLSVSGKLRHGKKSELIDCLQTASQHTKAVVDLKTIDGAAAVHIFTPTTACKTFQDYADKVFLQLDRKEIKNVKCKAIVLDRYVENSLKDDARESRGRGI